VVSTTEGTENTMRAIAMTTMALSAVLMLAQPTRADDVRVRIDSTGDRWRWIPATTVMERRDVCVPGHFETRLETVTDPGHYESREKRVWVPAVTVYERRTREVPAVSIDRHGVRFTNTTTVCESVPVTRGGYWTTVCEKVWVAGCTRTVERQVWIPEHTECRDVACEVPGHWERTAYRDHGVRLTLRFGR
jgi:hypothetical protein